VSSRTVSIAALCTLLVVIAGLVGCAIRPKGATPPILLISTPQPFPPTATAQRDIHVYVAGEVAKPDVYVLKRGDRVNDAVKAAGGLTADADRERTNLAALLIDGQEILVQRRGVATATPGKLSTAAAKASATAANTSNIVNINTATAAELHTLPGIGPTTAQRIVDYRQQHGPFTSTGDLLKAGVHKAVYEQIKDRVTL